ncbi:alginate export family protein [Desertibaculum subflavum]|uniref:alginate export family protein n=1 Tax=Desertibaculum subflavum TaxID=2268458 RepID=UPI000E66FA76
MRHSGSAVTLAAAILTAAAMQAEAQDRPAIKSHRFDEDWRALCAPGARTELLDPLKCIALADDLTLTFGGELRERFETAHNPDFGLEQDDDDVLLHRLFVHADLRLRDVLRGFIQLGVLEQSGRDGGSGPNDVDHLDVMQAFLDLTGGVAGGRATLRGGRQEMSFGSSRLVSVRESPNARRAFDGGRGFWAGAGYRIDAFYVRPVIIEPGTFDDPTNDDEQFWGAYASGPVAGPLKADLYYLGFDRERGVFAIGTAGERRHTLGTRLFGVSGLLDWDVEAAYQFGTFGGRDIRAWTVASDAGVKLPPLPFEPRLGLKADIASGDRRPDDGKLGTFNALYPKLPYFSEANLVAPANFFDIHPNVQLQLTEGLTVELGWNALWRHTTRDAVYGPPLSPIPDTAGRGGRFIGHQAIVGLEWQLNAYLTVAGQYVHFSPGGALRRAGAEDVDFLSASVAFRF